MLLIIFIIKLIYILEFKVCSSVITIFIIKHELENYINRVNEFRQPLN